MTKFDRETFATTSFLKEGDEEPVSFGHAEVVILGPAEVVMIIETLDMIFAESLQSLRRDNKDDDIDEPRHFGLIT